MHQASPSALLNQLIERKVRPHTVGGGYYFYISGLRSLVNFSVRLKGA